jgi:hypothetical protein
MEVYSTHLESFHLSLLIILNSRKVKMVGPEGFEPPTKGL